MHAAWSGDGDHIAFTRKQKTQDGSEQWVWVMDADGTDQQPVTAGPVDSKPAWSPDRELIVFTRVDAVQADLFVVNAFGNGTPVNLTNHPAVDDAADWQPIPSTADLGLAMTPAR